VHAVLDRHGLVSHGRKRRYKAQGTVLLKPTHPNDLWCADYKGEFMLADKRYCYPLTITDFATRYLLSCEALSTTQEIYVFSIFERAFKEFGLNIGSPTRARAWDLRIYTPARRSTGAGCGRFETSWLSVFQL